MTNLMAELPGYGAEWFGPQAMTNVLSFRNIAKQYLSDTYKNLIHFKFS